NSLFVDSLSAEYTEIVPVTGAAVVAAADDAGAAVAAGVAPPHAATAAVAPASLRNVRRSYLLSIPMSLPPARRTRVVRSLPFRLAVTRRSGLAPHESIARRSTAAPC